MQNESILIVDDDRLVCDSLSEFLRLEGYHIETALSGAEALDKLELDQYEIVITDVSMPKMTGFQLLLEIKAKYPDVIVILITGYGSIEDAVNAIKYGAYEYVTKPLNDNEVKLVIDRALEQRRLRRENEELRQKLEATFRFDNIIGHDHKMQKIFELISIVARTDATVLISGENGTGKTMIARAIHYNSLRKDKPLIEVSCGALSENLLESELFGHARGSFTGAVATKQGKFEVANGGTIFLDEIDTLPLSLQVKLLRVLQDRKFEKVGSNETITADVRIVAAANTELKEEVREGRFRQDLFYRLNVVSVNLPSLRERTGDIPLLVEHFIARLSQRNKKKMLGIDDDGIGYMMRYQWPGNVRELENAIESAMILARSEFIGVEDLPTHIKLDDSGEGVSREIGTLKNEVARFESKLIKEALERNGGNRELTCAMLGINRSTLYNKMKRYNVT